MLRRGVVVAGAGIVAAVLLVRRRRRRELAMLGPAGAAPRTDRLGCGGFRVMCTYQEMSPPKEVKGGCERWGRRKSSLR